MCGIAGFVNFNQQLEEQRPVFACMQQTLHRRGPDARGLYIQSPAALIHARLSVVDLENGRQPMHLSVGERRYVLVYNGELYNTAELRAVLEERGHRLESHSDTEVLLHSFAEWGEECVHRLNGIFAFAVWEEGSETLFAARDRIGVKPFFYSLAGGGFLFGSEIKALLEHPAVAPAITQEGVAEIMLLGPGRTPGCGVFRDIAELEPGCCARYSRDGLRTRRYWKLEDREHTDSFARTAETVRELVCDSIRRQLVSDVPVGTFLSGGLDSSIISAVADADFQSRGGRLQTFSVDYRDNARHFQASKFQPNSDASFIRRMNDALQAEHHDMLLDTAELADALYEAVEARDLPGMADVDSSLLLFCRRIREHVTVALSGECADEIFGGYPWFRDREIRERDGFPWAQSTDYRRSFLAPEFAGIDAAGYVDARYRQTLEETSVLPGTSPDERRMKQMVGLNLRWFMQTLLDRKDRMSMYSGLEVRVPFCDYRIAEYLYGVPWEFKDYQNQEKGLLRTAMTGLLPDEVLWRKKSPYPKTHNPAYRQLVADRLREVMRDPAAPLLQLARRDSLEELLATDRAVPWYGQLMTTPQTIAYFVQVDHWMRRYQVTLA